MSGVVISGHSQPWQAVYSELLRVGVATVDAQAKALGLGQRWRARKARPISADRLATALGEFAKVNRAHVEIRALCTPDGARWVCSITPLLPV